MFTCTGALTLPEELERFDDANMLASFGSVLRLPLLEA